MPNQPVIGVKTRRACQVVIDNSLGRTPVLTFAVEDVVLLEGGDVFRQGGQNLQVQFAPCAQIALVNPATDELTGEVVNHDHLYQVIYSLFRSLVP